MNPWGFHNKCVLIGLRGLTGDMREGNLLTDRQTDRQTDRLIKFCFYGIKYCVLYNTKGISVH